MLLKHSTLHKDDQADNFNKMISKLDLKTNIIEATTMNKQQNPYFEQMLVGSQTQYKRTGHWRKYKVMLSWHWFNAISKYFNH